MPAAGFFQQLFLTRFSSPSHDRRLYRELQRQNVRRIVEIGVGAGQRAVHFISLALRENAPEAVKYTGIDLFEGRPGASAEHHLKEVHRKLQATGVSVRLVPGDAASALQRTANDLRGTDWVVIAREQDPASIHACWHFLPRMLHLKSQVWVQQQDGHYDVLTSRDVSEQMLLRRRKAA